MSKTRAGNPILRDGEGITLVDVGGGSFVGLDEVAAACGDTVFGGFADRWPLAKVRTTTLVAV